MEESLKARLIGAAVLVAIAVLLIPELLSGRKAADPAGDEGAGARGTRTFTIELGGAPGEPARSVAPVPAPQAGTQGPPASESLPRPSDSQPEPDAEPVPEPAAEPASQVARPAAPAEAAGEQRTTSTTSEAPPAAESRPQAAPPAPTGAWAVQVGAFGSVESARNLVKELTAAGYHAYIAPVTRSGKTLHRVRVGPEADRARAEQLAKALQGRKLPATVVPND